MIKFSEFSFLDVSTDLTKFQQNPWGWGGKGWAILHRMILVWKLLACWTGTYASWLSKFKTRLNTLQCQISVPQLLLIFQIFVGPPFFLLRSPPSPLPLPPLPLSYLDPPSPHSLIFFKKNIYLQANLTAVFFFSEYCSSEIVIVSSVFFMTYEFERFYKILLIIECYRHSSNPVSILVEG